MATHRRNHNTQQHDEEVSTCREKDSTLNTSNNAVRMVGTVAHGAAMRRPTNKSVLFLVGLVVLLFTDTASVEYLMTTMSLDSRHLQLVVDDMAGSSQYQTSVMETYNKHHHESTDEHKPARRLRTVREIKNQMVLPCNYIHDGYYIADSNEILSQVYQTLMKYHLNENDDDTIPVLVEVGGHDGITKSLSLKASRCLAMNTLLIEASPNNYRTLEQARGKYDVTVNAALCDGPDVQLVQEDWNSGTNHIVKGAREAQTKTTVRVNCTSVDAEMDKLRATLPVAQQDKVHLIMLILDVEGSEATAIRGIQRYRPQKVFMETKHLKKPAHQKINAWAAQQHNLTGVKCNKQDTCFDFDPLIHEQPIEYLKSILFGARHAHPEHTYLTKKASGAYMFYGE